MKRRSVHASRLVVFAFTGVTIAGIAVACFDTSGLTGGESPSEDGSTSADSSADGSMSADSNEGSDGSPSDAGCTMFEDVCNGSSAIDIAAGNHFGCALLASGKVWCWGSNAYGQLGQPPTLGLLAPTEVPGLSGVTAIRAGNAFVCAMKADHTVACWGENQSGQLGHDPSSDSQCGGTPCNATPTPVPRVSYATAISANYYNACALNSDGSIACWGDNALAQLGVVSDGGFMATATSVTSDRAPDGSVTSGASVTCFLQPPGGYVLCLGSNLNDALGHAPYTYGDIDSGFGYSMNPIAEPVVDSVDAAIPRFSDLCYGAQHGCGIVSGNTLCWGAFGGPNGIFMERPITHIVADASAATQVACGAFHTCILQGDAGDVLCWGNNWDFAVGTGPQDGGVYGAVQDPTPVGIRAVLIRGGYGQTLAIDANGDVWQWGAGDAFADASAQWTPRELEGLP